MKLRELASILYSNRDGIVSAIVYDRDRDLDIMTGCSVEYAVAHYGESEIYQITPEDNNLVLHLTNVQEV